MAPNIIAKNTYLHFLGSWSNFDGEIEFKYNIFAFADYPDNYKNKYGNKGK